MWLYKLLCVFILATATVKASFCTFWWSSCNKACGGGVKTRNCLTGGPESESCNEVCYYGNPYSGGCRCSAWRTGYCCEGCLKTGIAHCKPGKFECGGIPDGIRCTDCYLPYKPGGFNNGCVRKPCNENNGGCSHICTAVSGLTKCTCRGGYQLSSDEYNCIDIDECMTRTARCGQQCVNTNGSYRCTCDSGYRLNPDGFTCDAERYYESNKTTWQNVTCNLGEPQLKYNNTLFEVNETFSNNEDVWIGYIYAKVPFLLLGLLCICVNESVDTHATSCLGGDQNSLCNNCSEIYTQINVNASNVGDPGTKPEGDCLAYYYPHFKWQPCSRTDYIRSICSNATYTDITAAATINDTTTGEWSAGNKLCLTNGRHPSFERSITNTGFGTLQAQYYWTGVFRAKILIKRSLQECFSRVSTDSYVYVTRDSKLLHVSNNDETKRALCVKGPRSTFKTPDTCKYPTEVTISITQSTYSVASDSLTKVTTPDVTTMYGSTSSLQTTQMYTTRHLETTDYTKEVASSTTQSNYPETSVIVTKETTPCVTTTVGSKSSLSTTHMYTALTTGYESPSSNDRIIQGNRQNNSEKSPALGIGISVGILFLVGGAVVIAVLKRRGIVHCTCKTGSNKPLADEPVFRENMTYGKSNEDNVAHHNYFILEKCGQSISNNAEHYSESNEANMEDDYNTIHATEEPYEHVNVENSDYDHTTNVLTSESDVRKTENVYNKLKMDRLGQSGHGQRHGLNVFQDSEDNYDTTSAVVTHGKDDDSDYNHIPQTASKASVRGDAIKGDKGGDYDAINSIKFKVAKADDSDYAHVNTDQIK